MGFLGTFLMGLLGSLMGFFGKYLSQKLVTGAAYITLCIALFGILVTTIQGLLATIVYSINDSFILTVIYMLWPPHLTICIGAVITGTLARWVFDESTRRAKALTMVTS